MSRAIKFNHPRLPQTLHFLRMRARLTQEETSEEVRKLEGQLSATWLSRLERGKEQPSERLVDLLLAVFGSNRDELYELLEHESEEPAINTAQYDWRLRAQAESVPAALFSAQSLGSQEASPLLASAGSVSMYHMSNSASKQEGALIQSFRALPSRVQRSVVSHVSLLEDEYTGKARD